MIDPQELVNSIGAAQRATEQAIATGDLAAAEASAQEQHQHLTTGFAYLRDVLGLDLDWDAAAGNTTGAKGAQARGGGSKDAPATVTQD